MSASRRLGPYELVGQGGMGEVWKARDTRSSGCAGWYAPPAGRGDGYLLFLRRRNLLVQRLDRRTGRLSATRRCWRAVCASWPTRSPACRSPHAGSWSASPTSRA